MKFCRFNENGIAAIREQLPQIKVVDDLARAEVPVFDCRKMDSWLHGKEFQDYLGGQAQLKPGEYMYVYQKVA